MGNINNLEHTPESPTLILYPAALPLCFAFLNKAVQRYLGEPPTFPLEALSLAMETQLLHSLLPPSPPGHLSRAGCTQLFVLAAEECVHCLPAAILNGPV